MDKFKFIKKKNVLQLPSSVGIYAFCRGKEVFYIGKAINIKKRVKSHFQQPGFKIALFINKVTKIGVIETDSEIEALILEAKLIKKYGPKYNVVWRDDKNFFYVGITEEDYPRVFITHQVKVKNQKSKIKSQFIGPFVEGRTVKKTLKFLRKIFPYYSIKKHPLRPCPWCQLELCPGPHPNQKEYRKNIRNLTRVLSGKSKVVLKSLVSEMRIEASLQNYEKAAEIKDQIEALKRILAHAKVFVHIKIKKGDWLKAEKKLKKMLKIRRKISRIEAYDVSALQGKKATGSMAVFIKGEPDKNCYRKFRIKIEGKPNDVAMIREILERRLEHSEWKWPQIILIDGGKAQLNVAITTKSRKRTTKNIRVISLAKKQNKLYVEGCPEPLRLKDTPREIFNLILQLRDEAHRFAISYHKNLRKRGLFI